MKRKTQADVRKAMEKLEPLDLSKCNTVSELLHGMSRCSFGARMLGEVADTLEKWFTDGNPTTVIYDGRFGSKLYFILQYMLHQNWVRDIVTSREYTSEASPTYGKRILVAGRCADATFLELCKRKPGAIFINAEGQALPEQVRDGFFPNVVFSDPVFILHLLCLAFQERLLGKKVTVSKLFYGLAGLGGLSAEVASGGETLLAMCEDKRCTKFLTLSGAMTVAKMQLLVCDMIDQGMVDYIASTGALMAHGLIEGIGDAHYKYDPKHSDALLASQGINRVTDTLEPEENFDHLDEVMNAVLERFSGRRQISPSILHRAIGGHLREHFPACRGILRSAYDKKVPVCVPAFHDSEIGNDVFVHNKLRRAAERPEIIMNMELDTQVLITMSQRSNRMGIFSIGGGVPRNNTQNVAPLIEIARNRGAAKWSMRKFRYGCRIDPTPLWYGNLSGCTYSEGGSWRKMDLERGKFAEVHADATIVWPFILKYVMENRKG